MNAVREMEHECRNISFGWSVDDECCKTFMFIGSFNALVGRINLSQVRRLLQVLIKTLVCFSRKKEETLTAPLRR